MKLILLLLALALAGASGCATRRPDLPTPTLVDVPAFMGNWYVVGYTPIVVDKQAHNAVEHYALDDRGRILTTYQFRKGSFDGPVKTFTPTGFVHNRDTGAEWRMQFVWPFKARYIIMYLSEDGQRTIIAHPNRKYAWIMQRSPDVDEAAYQALLDQLSDQGFDPDTIQRVPHDWTEESARLRAIAEAGSRFPLAPR